MKFFSLLLIASLLSSSFCYASRGDNERQYCSDLILQNLKKQFPNDQVSGRYDKTDDDLYIYLSGPSFNFSEYWKVAHHVITSIPQILQYSGIRKVKHFPDMDNKAGFDAIYLTSSGHTYELLGWWKRNYAGKSWWH
jgi:hypothetical protein|tara:strand:- start:3185 stop:3595 length:411 start_codon:yes stop_codon:yes gene_type:complete